MTTKSVSFDWCWNLTREGSAVADRKWVLTAMNQHGDSLINLLWRILGQEQDVCDAYQETFLKLAHCQDDIRPRNIKAYLFRTAGNVAVSHLRKKKRHLQACQQIALNLPTNQNEYVLGELDQMELQQKLRYQILQLPQYLRNVVILHDLGDMSYQQVAKTLGISVATARVYRCRAIQFLAARLADRKEK